MNAAAGSYDIHVEARGPHWIGWITRSGETKPHRSVVLIAATEDEARKRAADWARVAD
jgi:hypothetical protein